MALQNTLNGDTKPGHHHHHQQHASLCSRCRGACRPTRLCRCSWLRRGCALLCGAMILSALLPGAPLSHWLLSKDAERQRLLAEKEVRWKRSQLFLSQYRARQGRQGDTPTPGVRAPRAADVGVAVLTMSRERRLHQKVNYRTESLTESVATLLQLGNDTSLRKTYTFLLCNVDENPELFQESKALEDILPVFKRFQSPEDSVSVEKLTIWEKLKMDYVYCLQQTLAQGVQYVLLVEDDAVAHQDLFPVLEHVLEEVVEAPRARPVAYIKLYHPLRLLNYISLEAERLPELLALSLTLGAILTCLTGGYQNILHNNLPGISHRTVWVRWAGWTVVVAVLALSIGRTNLLELRRLSSYLYQVTPTPSCCTPAILYTRQGAQDLSDFLLSVECTKTRSTDMRMDEFRQKRAENRGLLVQPNLFTHVGMVSGLHRKEVNPLIVQ